MPLEVPHGGAGTCRRRRGGAAALHRQRPRQRRQVRDRRHP
uniref:Uncharacterized protein n=1 Tax=Arundo donax TaxID=35708 RepID=A0A0A8ZWJ7_ARUDO